MTFDEWITSHKAYNSLEWFDVDLLRECWEAALSTALRSPAPAATGEARAWLDPNTGMVSGYPGGPYTVALVPATTPHAQGDAMRAQVESALNSAFDEITKLCNRLDVDSFSLREISKALAAVRGAGGEGG